MKLSAVVAAAAAALLAAPEVAAGGISLKIGAFSNWGCGSSGATTQAKSRCTSSSSFFVNHRANGQTLCSSVQTRATPKNIVCPFNWSQHTTANCCIPQKEYQQCDCGEGFLFSQDSLLCKTPTNTCGANKWYHPRSKKCCDNSWEHNPPRGNCPTGVRCPTNWFWHSGSNCCRPQHPRAPEPDCDDWDDHSQCCGSHKPTPSAGVGGGGKRPHGHRHHKRDQTAFPQSDIDEIYCPQNLHACTVPTSSGVWAWECVDVTSELRSCGGCVAGGNGTDCTSIPFANEVQCAKGACIVNSCKAGYRARGSTCVAM